LVEVLRQIAVAPDLPAGEISVDLFVSGAEVVVTPFAILQPQQGVPEQIPAARLLEVLGREQRGEQHLLRAGPIHLLPDDALDVAQGPEPEGEEAVDAGAHAPDVPGTGQQDVAGAGGVGRGLLQGGEQGAVVTHGGGWLPRASHAKKAAARAVDSEKAARDWPTRPEGARGFRDERAPGVSRPEASSGESGVSRVATVGVEDPGRRAARGRGAPPWAPRCHAPGPAPG